MPTQIKDVHQPRGLSRWAYRLPRWLFHLHLGWILGGRFLLLVHQGRKSGLPRQAVLEVLSHDRVRNSYCVFAGWGERADWVRNVEKTPEVSITVGRHRFTAIARRLPPTEVEEAVLDYARRYPIARRVLPRLMGYHLDGTEEDFCAFARLGIVVAFQAHASIETSSKISR
jgi:deazaflavin-dependent oxidoreductase (nitroreductase family)